jgi:hypothetical protein
MAHVRRRRTANVSRLGGSVRIVAARYVADYEQQLGRIIGEEDYTQLVFNPIGHSAPPGAQRRRHEALSVRRRLRSELALLQLPTDEKRWIGVRDVFEVDGRSVPDRATRITSLLKLPFGTVGDQWRALEEDSSRFNIGTIRRTFNVPTFVLVFLRSDNQHGFDFDAPRLEGPDVLVTYREVDRPTFVRDEQGDDEPARGFIRHGRRSRQSRCARAGRRLLRA